MNPPIPAEMSTDINFQPEQSVFRAVSVWMDEFYSDPENRAAYAAWCEANGLENDLPEEEDINFPPSWRKVGEAVEV